ncbi:hypothetical protein BDZ91DRAFT_764689 [Kalaharituber pfeilii]|nr:hypothetical protein BDZ91DRAFT_764689 [Kalaharituber pfeilii]
MGRTTVTRAAAYTSKVVREYGVKTQNGVIRNALGVRRIPNWLRNRKEIEELVAEIEMLPEEKQDAARKRYFRPGEREYDENCYIVPPPVAKRRIVEPVTAPALAPAPSPEALSAQTLEATQPDMPTVKQALRPATPPPASVVLSSNAVSLSAKHKGGAVRRKAARSQGHNLVRKTKKAAPRKRPTVVAAHTPAAAIAEAVDPGVPREIEEDGADNELLALLEAGMAEEED